VKVVEDRPLILCINIYLEYLFEKLRAFVVSFVSLNLGMSSGAIGAKGYVFYVKRFVLNMATAANWLRCVFAPAVEFFFDGARGRLLLCWT
jgi:hypothetical protein